MPRGRPPKRRFFNFLRFNQSREHENKLPQSVSIITNVRDDLSQSTPNNSTHKIQTSTSKLLPFSVVIEARNQIPHSSFENAIHENQPSTSRPMRSAKKDCINRLQEVLKDLNDSQLQELRHKVNQRNKKRRKSESIEEREQRQRNDRLRASIRRALESPEQRDQRLRLSRFRERQRRAERYEERRQQRLQEQLRRNETHQRPLLLNNLQTYSLAVTSDVSTHTLGKRLENLESQIKMLVKHPISEEAVSTIEHHENLEVLLDPDISHFIQNYVQDSSLLRGELVMESTFVKEEPVSDSESVVPNGIESYKLSNDTCIPPNFGNLETIIKKEPDVSEDERL